LLEPGIAAGALAPVRLNSVDQAVREADAEIVRSKARAATGELANITRQFILTESTDEILRQLVQLYSRATRSQLTNSHILRAMLKGIAHAMPELEREAVRLGRLKRPRNIRGQEHARESFERKISSAFMAGLRTASLFE
jgi:hypothetical protein